MNDSNPKESNQMLREKQDNEIMRRMLQWLGAAVILEVFVLLANRFYFHYRTTEINFMLKLHDALVVLPFIALLSGVVFAVWAVCVKKKNPDAGLYQTILAVLFVAIGVCCFLFRTFGNPSIRLLQGVVPALAVLIMIFYLYQKEFFIIASMSGLGIVGLWICRTGGIDHITLFYAYMAAVFILLIACAAFAVKLKKTDGALTIGKKNLAVLSEDGEYTVILITCAVVAAVLVAAALVGASFAFYAIWGMIAWIFIMAVYFTARLM